MIWLILGLAIWVAGHFYKRLAPASRAALQDRMGDGSKGVIAVVLLASIVLMVIGYRNWFALPAYMTPTWGIHLNNLLMFFAIILFGLGSSKSRLNGLLRHPMLTGMVVFCGAHLLVNGDWASVVLFGGLGLWAIAEMIVINRAVPEWEKPAPGNAAGDAKLILIAIVLFVVITGIHRWIGPSPFPG
jgi:uncharacterized membrane protein